MHVRFVLFASLLASTLGAQAQEPKSGVSESTDPATVAAVERAADELKARQASHHGSGSGAEPAPITRSQTDSGFEFLSGGVTSEDRKAMLAERAPYSLWVATVAKPSGAYPTDAHLRIVALKDGSPVIDRAMDGPWCFISLPVGGYEVTASVRVDERQAPQTLVSRVAVVQGRQRQVVLRFESKADVGGDGGQSAANPFATPPQVH